MKSRVVRGFVAVFALIGTVEGALGSGQPFAVVDALRVVP